MKQCAYCETEFEVVFSEEDQAVEYCPACGEPLLEELDFE